MIDGYFDLEKTARQRDPVNGIRFIMSATSLLSFTKSCYCPKGMGIETNVLSYIHILQSSLSYYTPLISNQKAGSYVLKVNMLLLAWFTIVLCLKYEGNLNYPEVQLMWEF
jgi:hypothetical protein